MGLQPRDFLHIPEETRRVAQAAFPKGNNYMTMRDSLALWYKDSDYTHLFLSHQGQPALSPGRLNLIMIMQYAEGLSDQQTVEAVASRIDWKYALGLELTEASFDASVLSDHRQRLLVQGAEVQLFDQMLSQFQQQGLLKTKGKQRTDSTQVLAAIRDLNRLECLGETFRHCLNSLAVVVPEWLRLQASLEWFERYGPRFEQYRLPKGKQERQQVAEQIGRDGQQLLQAVYAAQELPWLAEIPAVEVLRQVWLQQFMTKEGQLRLRESGNLPPAELMIQTPYDPEARYSWKRQTEWTGYKVHLTETCDEDAPHLITNVETTPATTPDDQLTDIIHQHLAQKQRLPQEHLVDTGYTNADHFVKAQAEYKLKLIGPVQQASNWQAQTEAGFDLSCFVIDWQTQQVTCPEGKTSVSWTPRLDKGRHPIFEVRFGKAECARCLSRPLCTQAKTNARTLKFRQQPQYEALQAARHDQHTPEFKERYQKRAGVEGTLSLAVRAFGLRRSRYIGLAKTHLQHLLTAAAINLARAVAWRQHKPLAKTRLSPFAALAPAPLHN